MTVTVYALLSKAEFNDALSNMVHAARALDTEPTQVYLSCPITLDQEEQHIALEYHLPNCTPAALLLENGDMLKDKLSIVVERASASETDCYIFVSCLPTILATKAIFSSEQAKRAQESTVKLLIRGDRSWMSSAVADPSATKFIATSKSGIDLPIPYRSSALSLERVAAAIATTIYHGKSELPGNVICQIDTGSAALISQILDKSNTAPKQEEAFEIRNQLIRQMLGAAAAKKVIKSKRWQPRKSDLTSTAFFVSSLLPRFRLSLQETSNEPRRFDSSELAKEHPDDYVYACILDRLLRGSTDPSRPTALAVNYIQELLRTVLRQLEQEDMFTDASSPIGRVTSGLDIIIKNAAHPTDDLFDFLADHANEGGLSAIAIVMWGWSDRFGDTVEKRLSSVDYPKIRQLSMTLVAAAGGYCELPVAYSKRQLWLALYRQCWRHLISAGNGEIAKEQVPTLNEPLDKSSNSETRLVFPIAEGDEISIALVVRDARLATIRKLENYLNGSDAQRASACVAIAALYRRYEELFPPKARNHVHVTFSFPGHTIDWNAKRKRNVVKSVPIRDFEQSFDVPDARLFADQLSSRWIEKFVTSLSDVELRQLSESLSSP
jgi:hypothetical protein